MHLGLQKAPLQSMIKRSAVVLGAEGIAEEDLDDVNRLR